MGQGEYNHSHDDDLQQREDPDGDGEFVFQVTCFSADRCVFGCADENTFFAEQRVQNDSGHRIQDVDHAADGGGDTCPGFKASLSPSEEK